VRKLLAHCVPNSLCMTYDNDTQLSPTCLEHQYADGQVSNRTCTHHECGPGSGPGPSETLTYAPSGGIVSPGSHPPAVAHSCCSPTMTRSGLGQEGASTAALLIAAAVTDCSVPRRMLSGTASLRDGPLSPSLPVGSSGRSSTPSRRPAGLAAGSQSWHGAS